MRFLLWATAFACFYTLGESIGIPPLLAYGASIVDNVLYIAGGYSATIYATIFEINELWSLDLSQPIANLSSPPWKLQGYGPRSTAYSHLISLDRENLALWGGTEPYNNQTSTTKSMFIYSIQNGDWTWGGESPTARLFSTLVSDGSGGAILYGGLEWSQFPVSSKLGNATFRLDIASRQWTQLDYGGVQPEIRMGHTACMNRKGEMIILGGFSRGRKGLVPMNEVLVYDVKSNSWTSHKTNGTALPPPRIGHAATILADDSILIHGGSDPDVTKIYGDFWLLRDWTWTKLEPANAPKYGLTDHKMFTIGTNVLVLPGRSSVDKKNWMVDLLVLDTTKFAFVPQYTPSTIGTITN
ncbi:uncharacterized protein VTP21DRAFT_7392 [Calcarisporiella thermophila]|uniref:uncharacterized protein n=1 Tax=Calcarisporiella thermophila TaxID=911321 RepID=UPI00374305D7